MGKIRPISHGRIGFASLCSLSNASRRSTVSWRRQTTVTSASVAGFFFFNRSQMRYLSHLPKRWRAAMVSRTQYRTIATVMIELETCHRISSIREGNVKSHLIKWNAANAKVMQNKANLFSGLISGNQSYGNRRRGLSGLSKPAKEVRHQGQGDRADTGNTKSQTDWPSFGTKDQIPGWLRDNDYIVGGHPMPTYSYHRSFRLWRCWHMETMNIWTHLVGSTAFVTADMLLCRIFASGKQHFNSGDMFAFGSFITAAAVCFGFSMAFHTL